MNHRQHLLEKFINFYPPFLGAGIRSRAIDERTIEVVMNLTAFNRNLAGVHFGGSLYAMCDPWFIPHSVTNCAFLEGGKRNL